MKKLNKKILIIIIVSVIIFISAILILLYIRINDNIPSKEEKKYPVNSTFNNSLIDDYNPIYFEWKNKKYVFFQQSDSNIVFIAVKIAEQQQGNWLSEDYSPVFVIYKKNYKDITSLLIYEDRLYTFKDNSITMYDLSDEQTKKKKVTINEIYGIYNNNIYIKSKNDLKQIDANLNNISTIRQLPEKYQVIPRKYKFAI